MKKIDERAFEPLDEYEKELIEFLDREVELKELSLVRKKYFEELAKITLKNLSTRPKYIIYFNDKKKVQMQGRFLQD